MLLRCLNVQQYLLRPAEEHFSISKSQDFMPKVGFFKTSKTLKRESNIFWFSDPNISLHCSILFACPFPLVEDVLAQKETSFLIHLVIKDNAEVLQGVKYLLRPFPASTLR
jgi:hypothetical protein